jgi:lambda family phage portal protein
MAYRFTRPGDPPSIYRGVGGAVARAVDAVLSPFAPRTVLQRQHARAQLLNYDMAQRKRTRRVQRAGSADTDLLQDLPELRKNSRAMTRDDGAASALVQVLEDNVVGTGLRPQMMVDRERTGLSDSEADRWNREVEQVFDDAAREHLDATEHDSFWSMQALALRTIVTDGECLLHRIYIEDKQRTIGTAYEIVDVDRLVDPPNAGGRDIRSGIEIGDRLQALAYWITPRHPGENLGRWPTDRLRLNKPERWVRHAGGQMSILHVFKRKRPGLTRGVPLLAPCFGLVEAMNDMLETELNAARAAAKFCAFIKQTLDPANLPNNLEQDQDAQWHERLESATIRYLNPGEEVQAFNPNRPGNNFDPFVVRVLRSICAATNLPYELVLKDFGGMTYSSARVALLEARRGFEVLQQMLVEKLCAPVFRSVVIDAVIHGKLRMPRGFLDNPEPFVHAYWQPPAWGWVDPVKEIEASRLAIESNLSTPQAEAARQGGNAEANAEMKARYLKHCYALEKRYGLDKGELTRERSERIETVQAPESEATPPAQKAPVEEPAQ